MQWLIVQGRLGPCNMPCGRGHYATIVIKRTSATFMYVHYRRVFTEQVQYSRPGYIQHASSSPTFFSLSGFPPSNTASPLEIGRVICIFGETHETRECHAVTERSWGQWMEQHRRYRTKTLGLSTDWCRHRNGAGHVSFSAFSLTLALIQG
jgi:hypothetical protein